MKRWNQLFEESKRTLSDLCELFDVPEDEVAALQPLADRYPILISPYYLRLMNKWDATDPIRLMCLPHVATPADDGASAIEESSAILGGQHKYLQSVLIVSNDQCFTYGRHLYRRDFSRVSDDEASLRIPKLAEYISDHPEVDNISIGGGDAFLNSNERIGSYLKAFAFLPSISYIRFNTSVPATFPQRITEDDGELLALLARYAKAKAIVVVTQFNHPREFTDEACAAVRLLREAGCTVRNEAVLLHGVNDDPATLLELMNCLVQAGIDPYYLYQCRPASGIADGFQVPLAEAMRTVIAAKGDMSGMAKSFRFIMSHPTGKIEMLGFADDGRAVFQYHEARAEEDRARIFTCELADDQTWLA